MGILDYLFKETENGVVHLMSTLIMATWCKSCDMIGWSPYLPCFRNNFKKCWRRLKKLKSFDIRLIDSFTIPFVTTNISSSLPLLLGSQDKENDFWNV